MAIPFKHIEGNMSKRYVDCTFRDKHIRLYFSMNAMLDIEETYDLPMADILKGTNKEVFDRQCYILSVLSYEGKMIFKDEELYGLKLSDLSSVMPYEMTDLVTNMLEAIRLGFTREIEPEVVDEGLLELKKKKSKREKKGQKSLEQEKN